MMRRVRIKICGIRTIDEARAAVDLGVDALGFNFYPGSARYIDPEAARSIIDAVNPLVSCIGVFVNEQPGRLIEIAEDVRLDGVQLHGDETPEYCLGLGGIRTIKALRVGVDFDLDSICRYSVGAVLLDAARRGQFGGTGARFDWSIAVEAKRFAPIILAGGLTVENVLDAITTVRPFAIDVCSGVEAEPGRKDLSKLRRFMEAAKPAAWAEEEPDREEISL